MSVSVISLLISNLLLVINVLYFNANILTVLLIYFIEILITALLQISKIIYIYIFDKNQFISTDKKSYGKSCFFVILFGSFIFAAFQGITMSQFLLNLVFTNLNYQIDNNMVLSFAVIFTLSHLISYKVNFIDKLQNDSQTLETNTNEIQVNQAEELVTKKQTVDVAKIIIRVQSLTFISFIAVFFVAILNFLQLTNYMNYFVIVYCLIKIYFDYTSHIQQHDLKLDLK